MKLTGTALSPRLDLGSLDGWDRAQVLAGPARAARAPDDIRRVGAGLAAAGAAVDRGGGSATDTVAKTLTGATARPVHLGDPLKRVTRPRHRQRRVRRQPASTSTLCKRLGRYFKTCGQGEVGFAGSSRFGGRIELRISDCPSGVGSAGSTT